MRAFNYPLFKASLTVNKQLPVVELFDGIEYANGMTALTASMILSARGSEIRVRTIKGRHMKTRTCRACMVRNGEI